MRPCHVRHFLGTSEKKRDEMVRMAHLVNEVAGEQQATHVTDLGCGKGYLGTLLAINVISTIGLNITTGYTGLLSLGHGAFDRLDLALSITPFGLAARQRLAVGREARIVCVESTRHLEFIRPGRLQFGSGTGERGLDSSEFSLGRGGSLLGLVECRRSGAAACSTPSTSRVPSSRSAQATAG